jgi:1,4-alpha-glucan branching enzyme
VVYEHVDQMFHYFRVYTWPTRRAPRSSRVPLIRGWNVWGFGPAADFTQPFARDYFQTANRMWLDEFHVNGFRYDEVTDLYVPPRDAGYARWWNRPFATRFLSRAFSGPQDVRAASSNARTAPGRTMC